MCGAILQFQTYESVKELLEYESVEKQPQVKDRSQFLKRFCESFDSRHPLSVETFRTGDVLFQSSRQQEETAVSG